MRRLLVYFLAFASIVLLTDSSVYEAVAVIVSVYGFLTLVSKIGQYAALLDCIAFIAALEILLVPAITYWVFPASMPVESGVYFGYALAAWVAFYLGIMSFADGKLITEQVTCSQRVNNYLRQRPYASPLLLVIGLAGFLTKSFFPTTPTFVNTLPMYCLLVSVLYAYYAQYAYRALLGGFVLLILIVNIVRTGMFGDLFFWSILWLIFSVPNRVTPLTIRAKALGISVAFVFLLLIQSIKAEYRYNTWGYQRHERTTDATLLINLIVNRVTHPDKLLNINHFFTAFVRFNQGIMIGSAMAKVPLHEPYAQGEVLLSFLYPFVPRIVWAGKPQTGGYENIRRFTTLPQFENTSINLSPLGEGYINFGYGGVLFAYVYGVLLGGCFRIVFRLAVQMPSLILWLPMLYIGCLTMETDVLSTWGSLVNNALFVGLLYWVMKLVGIKL